MPQHGLEKAMQSLMRESPEPLHMMESALRRTIMDIRPRLLQHCGDLGAQESKKGKNKVLRLQRSGP